jgi:hypothetical protein
VTAVGETYQPDTFKLATASALGNTTVWQVGAGKTVVRLQGYILVVGGDAIQAAGGINIIGLNDSGGNQYGSFGVEIGAAVLASGVIFNSGAVLFGPNGVLVGGAGILRVNLGTALTGGTVRVVAWGSEE